jgi:hypothetical protein
MSTRLPGFKRECTTESLVVDGEAFPIKYRDRNCNPLLTRKGKPRQRKPGAGRPRKFQRRFKMPHMSVRGWNGSSYVCSETGERGKRDLWFSDRLHRPFRQCRIMSTRRPPAALE